MTRRNATAIVLACALLTLGAWIALARVTMPYTSDSAVYIEAAEHFAAGRGLVVTPYSVDPVDTDLHPLTIFPPGYPFLIWLTTRLGIDAARAALAVEGPCLALAPVLFFLLFSRVVAPSTAVVAALLCTWTSPLLTASLHAWSDVPFLVFALVSLELLFRGIAGGRVALVLAAGVAAALACLTRNVGYALVAAELVGVAAAIVLQPIVRRAAWRTIIAYAGGFVGVYGSWLVRNLVVLGRLQAYQFDPSDLTLTDNVRHFLRALVTVLVGPQSTGFAVALWTAAVLAATVWCAARGVRRLGARHDESTVTAAVVWSTLAAYALAGAALVVIARTRYGWGEYINERHVLQYHWVLLAAWVAGFGVLAPRERRRGYGAGFLVAIVVAAFVLVQVQGVYRFVEYATANAQPELQMVRALAPMVERLPHDALVASNDAPLLQITAGRSVRQINAADTLPRLRDAVTASRDLYVAVVPCRTFCRSLYGGRSAPAWLDVADGGAVPEAYEVLYRRDGSALLHAPRRGPDGAALDVRTDAGGGT